jgi:hypothetical protein
MNAILKIALAVLPVILMTGCGAKPSPPKISKTDLNEAAPATGQADVSAPAIATTKPGQTTVPITGAFGWTLGAKKPVSMPDNSVGMSDNIPVTNAPPFKEVQLSWLKDGTIYQIITWVDLNHLATVERALNDKYGPPGERALNSEEIEAKYISRVSIWTNAGCTIELSVGGGGGDESSLSYCDKALENKRFDEAMDENERRAKNLAPKL